MTNILKPEWKKQKIGDMLAHVIDNRGKTPPIEESGHELIEVNAIVEGLRTPQYNLVKKFVSDETYNTWFRTGNIQKGDVLVPTVGTIGSAVFSTEDRGAIAQNIIGLRTKQNVSSSFLYYKLISPEIKGKVRSLNIGVAQPSVKVPHFMNLELDMPTSVLAQDEIADILSAYDELIENNIHRIALLEQISKSIYTEWFGESDSDGKILALNNVISINRGKSYRGDELSENEGVPFINLKCMVRDGGFRKSGLKRFTGTYKDAQKAIAGEIVMAVTDMTQDRRIVARAARIPTLEGGFGVISMDLVKIQPKKGVNSDYIYALLRWSGFADEVKNHANGANVLHLIPDRITDYQTYIASPKRQEEFGVKVSPIFDLIDRIELQNESLFESRDLLIPKLVTSEIKI